MNELQRQFSKKFPHKFPRLSLKNSRRNCLKNHKKNRKFHQHGIFWKNTERLLKEVDDKIPKDINAEIYKGFTKSMPEIIAWEISKKLAKKN